MSGYNCDICEKSDFVDSYITDSFIMTKKYQGQQISFRVKSDRDFCKDCLKRFLKSINCELLDIKADGTLKIG